MSKNGLILLTPTSIVYTGTSATISANGSVSFTSCSSIELRGVFTADYDNYMLVSWYTSTGGAHNITAHLMSGSTPETGPNYTRQLLNFYDTTIGAGRSLNTNTFVFSRASSASVGGHVVSIYGPYLSQPTAYRAINKSADTSVLGQEEGGTHTLSNSYDGLQITNNAATQQTGRVAVYGMRK